jgi:hypothetical protein
MPTWKARTAPFGYRRKSAGPLDSSSIENTFCVDVLSDKGLRIIDPDESRKKSDKEFSYDKVYSPLDSQEDVYNGAARSLIDKCLEGYNGCIFAYGQTASGKTYTMNGPSGLDLNEGSKDRGLIQRAVEHIRKHISKQSGVKKLETTGERIRVEYSVKASFLEIYQESLKDLLCDDGAQGSS